jgi:quinone-modifying oxidoreductase subunit QmoC
MGLYFKDGFASGIKEGMKMKDVAIGLVLAKRLNPFELFGGHKCKDQKGIQAMLKKAYDIERSRKAAKMAG